jgi:hypothetical protein
MYVPAATSALLVVGRPSASCIPVFSHNLAAHDESPVSGDSARSYGVVQDNFCVSKLEAVWRVRAKRSAYDMKGAIVCGGNTTWTVLVPLHKAG